MEQRQVVREEPWASFVGESEPVKELKRQVERIAGVDRAVIVKGETGAGKELVAETIHSLSGRHRGQFVVVDCAALTESLIESELFGHKRGSFTGATEEKKGLLEVADGGTVLLDEIGDMRLDLQTRLLRFLDKRVVRHVGATHYVNMDVRIIATTRVGLLQAVRAGKFREDLYYRLNMTNVSVPPLRLRKKDIPLLVWHFAARAGTEILKSSEVPSRPDIADEALQVFVDYSWPGNVRELKYAVDRAWLFAEGNRILESDVRAALDPSEAEKKDGPRSAVNRPTWSEARVNWERQYFRDLLREFDGNKTRAAGAVGMKREHFHGKLVDLGLDEFIKHRQSS